MDKDSQGGLRRCWRSRTLPLLAWLVLLSVMSGRADGLPSDSSRVAYWAGEGDALDLAGSNPGQVVSEVAFERGILGKSFTFSGRPGAVFIPYSNVLAPKTFTYSAWIKPKAMPVDPVNLNQNLIVGQAFISGMAVRPGLAGPKLLGWLSTPDGSAPFVGSKDELVLNEYSHVAATYNGITLRIYVNGRLQGEVSASDYVPTAKYDFYIGGFSAQTGVAGQYFNGDIDEVALFDRALGESEIQALHSSLSAPTAPAQAIRFGAIPDRTVTSGPVDLVAYATSGLPVAFSVVSGPAVVAGDKLTMTAPGAITIEASQPGDATHQAAAPVRRSFKATLVLQSITFPAIASRTIVETPLVLSATASSGLPVAYSMVSGPALVVGNVVVLKGLGTVVVRASQAGNSVFEAAADVDRSFTVSKIGQTISFDRIPAKESVDPPFVLDVRASSTLPVNLEVVSGPATLTGSEVTLLGVGKVVLRASQPGNEFYEAASVDRSFQVYAAGDPRLISHWKAEENAEDALQQNPGTISGNVGFAPGKVGQGFDFRGLGSVKIASDATLLTESYSAETWVKINVKPASAGQAVLFGQPFGIAQLVIRSAGGFYRPRFAFGDGGGTYPGVDSSQFLSVGAFSHVVGTWDASTRKLRIWIDGVKTGEAVMASAPVASGKPFGIGGFTDEGQLFTGQVDEVSFYGRALTEAEIRERYEAGAPTSRLAQTITFAPLPETFPIGSTVTLSASATSVLPVTFSVVSGPAKIEGATLTLTGAGRVTVRAEQAGDANFSPAPVVEQSLTVPPPVRQSQVIAFGPLPNKLMGAAPFSVVATADSGLPVGFFVASGPATMSGSLVTVTGPGVVVIHAYQDGNAAYDPATPVDRAFTVQSVNTTPVIIPIPDLVVVGSRPADVQVEVNDAESPEGPFVIAASSSDPLLIPEAGLVLSGEGRARRLRLTAAEGRFGTARIRVTATDSIGASTTSEFGIEVRRPPLISAVADQVAEIKGIVGPIQVRLLDGGGLSGAVNWTFSSSNHELIPDDRILSTSQPDGRSIVIVPLADAVGWADITVRASDGVIFGETRFRVTIRRPNQPPKIGELPDVAIASGATRTVTFRVTDEDSSSETMKLTASSTRSDLIPPANIVFGGLAALRSATIAAVPGRSGAVTVTFTATDDAGASSSRSFNVRVLRDPTLAPVEPVEADMNSSFAPVALRMLDPGDLAGPARWSVESSDPELLSPEGMVFQSGPDGQYLLMTPVTGRSGTAVVTVRVGDGTVGGEIQFQANVHQVNQPPQIDPVFDQSLDIFQETTFSFTVHDPDGPADKLKVTAVSGREDMVAQDSLVLGGSSTNRTLKLASHSAQLGVCPITITVEDELGARSSRVVRVNLTPLPPITPVINVHQPAHSAFYMEGEWFLLEAEVQVEPHGFVTVGFYDGTALLSETTGESSTYTLSTRELAPGDHTIRIRASRQGAPWATVESTHKMTVVAEPIPNDWFVARTPLSSTPIVGRTSRATREPGEPVHSRLGSGPSVWYSFASPITARIWLSTRGSDFDTVLAVYTNAPVSELREVAANDDDPAGGLTSALTFDARAGVEYAIVVAGSQGASGNFRLEQRNVEPADNDLRIQAAQGSVTISWIDGAQVAGLGYQTTLSPNAALQPILQAPTVVGGRATLRQTITGEARFFRLMRSP